jgi:hypothetical protein
LRRLDNEFRSKSAISGRKLLISTAFGRNIDLIALLMRDSGLRRILKSHFDYYEHPRTHLSLGKGTPVSRPIQPATTGRIVKIAQVAGLHHRYERIAA